MRTERLFLLPTLALTLLLGAVVLISGIAHAAEPGSTGPFDDAGYPTRTGEKVWLVELEGPIGPATSDYLTSNLAKAARDGAVLVIIQMDTPGGLDLSMRAIIKAILASPVPVATYVAPGGSRAASAGTYIMYASHFAVMAPATNIGSSTPVSIGGESPFPLPGTNPGKEPVETPDAKKDNDPGNHRDKNTGKTGSDSSRPKTAMERKVINDAVAYIRGLADLRGRNPDWAEETVREAANLPARKALEMGVIDFIATDLSDLLQQLNGRTTVADGREITLKLDHPEIVRVTPGWRYDFLALITNPNVAYILLMIGIYGLILEFYHPGTGIPGVTGVICLLLGAFALQMLPINWAGVALILLGVVLMIAETFIPSFGVVGIGGVVAFVLGSIILMDSDLPGYQLSVPIIAAFAVTSAGLFIFALGAAIRARHGKVVTGEQALIGHKAIALEDFQGKGHVRVFSENWNAVSEKPISKGSAVRITAMDGLVLTVEPIEEINRIQE